MRFNEFNTINEDVLTEQELIVESALIDFLEDTITKEEFLNICEEQGITEVGSLISGGLKLYNKFGGKAKDFLGNLFKGKPKQGSLPLNNPNSIAGKAKDLVKKNPRKAAALGGAAVVGGATALGGGDDTPRGSDAAMAKPAPKKPEPKKEPSSFGKAFAAARKAHGGPGGVFTWKGKKYQTNIKGEKYVKNPTPVGGAPKPAQSAAQAQGGRAGGQGAELGAVKMPKGGGRGDGNVEVAARSKKAQRDAIKSKLQAKRQERDALIAKRAGQGYT